MERLITPLTHPFKNILTLPGSKSLTNRALLLAALAKGDSLLTGLLLSDDSYAMLSCLQALGVSFELDAPNHRIHIRGTQGLFAAHSAELYCHDAGTVTRFMLAACAALAKGKFHFSASARMSERPLGPLIRVLQEQGTEFKFEELSGCMPLQMSPHGLLGGNVNINIELSSQFLSGLLMAAPYAKSPLALSAGDLTLKSYVHMTLAIMKDFGIQARIEGQTLHVPLGHYQGRTYDIEPDASTASYFLAAAAISESTVTIQNFSRKGLQGDLQFLDVLEKMGCTIACSSNTLTLTGPKKLKAIPKVNMAGFSDTFMTLAVVAVFADQAMTLSGLAHTRLQESDRVAAISEGLRTLGVRVESTEDTLTVYPSAVNSGKIHSHNDHRIAMSLALLGLKVPGIVIGNAECVSKTCPDYFERLANMCHKLEC